MFTDLLMAYRNILRQRRRSVAALASVCIGVAALLLAGGFIEWIFQDMRESTIRSKLGHIQVVRPGYIQAGAADPFRYLLPSGSGILSALASHPKVEMVGQRLSFSGLISQAEDSISFVGEGVEPDKERVLSRSLQIVRGEDLSADEPLGLTLGSGLASNLGVAVGDKVVLMANGATGGVNAIECRVRGVFTTISKLYDDSALRLPIDAARTLLRVTGSHTWVVLLRDTGDTETVLAELRAQNAKGSFEFVPWFDLADFYKKTVTLFSRQIGALEIIIAGIILLSILNTMMVSVMERTGEVGTSLALGRKRHRIVGQFLVEGALLGLLGLIAGIVLGILVASFLSHVGIPMPPPPGMARGYVAGITITAPLIRDAVVLALATALVASFYPAWRVSRMPVVDALRHNR